MQCHHSVDIRSSMWFIMTRCNFSIENDLSCRRHRRSFTHNYTWINDQKLVSRCFGRRKSIECTSDDYMHKKCDDERWIKNCDVKWLLECIKYRNRILTLSNVKTTIKKTIQSLTRQNRGLSWVAGDEKVSIVLRRNQLSVNHINFKSGRYLNESHK